MGVVHACTTVLIRRLDISLWELVFSFNHVSPGDELRSSGLAASPFTCWAISPSPKIIYS